MEIGVFTFAETRVDPESGRQLQAGERIRRVVEEIQLADEVGLDVYGVGEHHRPDYSSSAPAVILAAGAARTKRIRLTSAVTVLSSDDPVRVFQDFATLDHLSNGRAEIMAGRGSFTESFPLFGQDLSDYDDLFSEEAGSAAPAPGNRAGHVERDAPSVDRRPRGVPPSVAGSATRLARGRRDAGVGGPGRPPRPPDGPRDHRWRTGPVRPVRGALSPVGAAGGARSRRAPSLDQQPRLHRRYGGGGRGARLRAVQRHHEPDRAGARLASDGARALRRGAAPGGGAHAGQPGRRDREDPVPATESSVTSGRSSSSPSGRCRTRRCYARSSCSGTVVAPAVREAVGKAGAPT